MKFKGKKLLLLTGSNGCNHIIQYAKENGAFVIATDMYEISDVKDMADLSYKISTTDIDGLKNIIIEQGIHGVTTGTSEASMYSIMTLSEDLGINFNATRSQVEAINHKDKFKKLLQDFNIRTPIEYTRDEDIIYPVIVKPVDSSGSKGITICHDKEGLKYSEEHAYKYSRSNKIIKEEYFHKLPEVIANYTIVDGRVSLSCLFDNYKVYNDKGFSGLPIFNKFPSKKINLWMEKVHPKIINMINYLEIKNGIFFPASFFDGNEFIIFEGGLRLPGGQSYTLIDEVNGLNYMKMMVDYSLLGKMSHSSDILDKDNPNFRMPCCQLNIPLNSGKITQIIGLDKIVKYDGVVNVTQIRNVGERVVFDGTTNQLAFRIHLCQSNETKLRQLVGNIMANLDIIDEAGDSMILDKSIMILP